MEPQYIKWGFFTEKASENWACHDYTTKLSVSIVYASIASVALSFFYQPGHTYLSGITDLVQISMTLSKSLIGFEVPVSTTLYLLNIPLFVLVWFKVEEKSIILTSITVTSTSLCIYILPETVLSTDLIIYALFGGAIMELGIGLALRNGLSPDGLDIVSITIRKETGKSIGSISICLNTLIVFVAGILSGWQYMFHSALSIFVSGRATDVVYTKQKRMQAMIVAKHPEKVVNGVQNYMRRGITIINEAEDAYKHDRQTVLMTVVTRYESSSFREAMKASDPQTFISIAENVQVLGRFYEDDIWIESDKNS